MISGRQGRKAVRRCSGTAPSSEDGAVIAWYGPGSAAHHEQRNQESAAGGMVWVALLMVHCARDTPLLLVFIFHGAYRRVRNDPAPAALAIRLAAVHPLAARRCERVSIPLLRPIAKRVAKPGAFGLEWR
jgi:hypothetical protein